MIARSPCPANQPSRHLAPHARAVTAVFVVALAAGCSSGRTIRGTTGAVDARAASGAPSSASYAPLPPPMVSADTVRETVIAPGVIHRYYFRASGPFAIHVLDVDRAACWTPAALKPDTVAAGRARTSVLLARSASDDTVAAVNADFFLFAPAGVPTGAHVDDGRVISGPMARPALVIDAAGRLRFMRLFAAGQAIAGSDTAPITEWNHIPLTQLGAFDHRWGAVVDSGVGVVRLVIGADGRVLGVRPAGERVQIPSGGWVLAAARTAPPAVKAWVRSRTVGERVIVATSLLPFVPHDAVGGFPMLAMDSMPAPALDSAHTQSLGRVRHPRTAVGIGDGGRRLVLAVVDGRREGYSAGMTLRELALLMLELGARDALNLDGGGSSAMAARAAGGAVRVLNRPSDPAGERAVANALAIVRGCTPSGR